MLKTLRKTCSLFMIAMVLMMNLPMPYIHAAMVGTEEIVHTQATQQERERIAAFLDQDAVQKQLQRLGVDADEAKARVAGLTDSEARMLAARIGELPAGGDAIGAVISAFVIVFLVLLFTDIMGFTNVFPFVKAQR